MQKRAAVVLFTALFALSAPLLAQTKAGSNTNRKQDLISRADTNGDAKISRDEFLEYERTRAEKIFDKLDTNKDGSVDRKELSAKKKRPRSGMDNKAQ